MINRDEQKSFFMIDPAIVEDNKKSYAIQASYKETYGLDTLGINPSIVHRNLSPTVLIEKAIRNGEGILTDTGALAVTTGKFTGRSPHDKYIVDTDGVHDLISWGDVNHPISREQFNEIPPHVEYSLTPMGRDLLPVFYAIMNWGFRYEDILYKNEKEE